MDDVLASLLAWHETGRQGALASLVWSSGSVPMSVRAKMLVARDGQVLGTIGGGCLEAEILAAAGRVTATGQAEVCQFTLTEEQAGAGGLNCGGSLRILTEPLPDAVVFGAVHQARLARRPCALLSLLGRRPAAGVPRMVVAPGRPSHGSLGNPDLDQWARSKALEVLGTGAVETALLYVDAAVAGGPGEVFIEPYLPAPRLLVFGGGHVGAQVCRLAAHVGFEVVVIDDRPQFANPQRHPAAHECVVLPMDQAFSALAVDDQSYVVAATRGHEHDEVVIEQAIRTPARYVGMLGSERKKVLMWERLLARGGDRQCLDRVFAPIGLDIGADTPEEIALSVVAELVLVRRGGGKNWKTKKSVLGRIP